MQLKYPLLNRPRVTTNQLLVLIASYFTLVFNFPFLYEFMTAIWALPTFNALFFISVPFFILSVLLILFSLVSSRWFIKPVLITLTLISALVFYGTLNYGVVFDYGMIENTIETDSAEALSYLNLEFLAFFIVFGILPSLLIASCKLTPQPMLIAVLDKLKLLCLACVTLAAIVFFYYQNYASVGRNNSHLVKYIVPTEYLVSSYKYLNEHYFSEPVQFTTLDNNPTDLTPESKQVMVLVVGETARAKNLSSNGYQKDTNRFTAKHSPLSFQHVSSCGTATAVSVPCMFSALSQQDFDRRTADNQQNLLDLIFLAGIDVLWIDNNGCKKVCRRIPTLTIDPSKESPLCDGQYCQDEALLTPLMAKLDNLTQNKTLIVLHMMGSHGPTYYKRYPNHIAPFAPACERSDIQNCTSEELVNTYDNTILYTDFVLSKVMLQLENLTDLYQTSLLYLSDHGESLGESGAYLHGLPYLLAPVEQKHIPMLYWHPQLSNSERSCIESLATTQTFSHDNLFHSVLGQLSVQSTAYQPSLDIFSACPSSLYANQTN